MNLRFEAEEFITQCYEELNKSPEEISQRIADVYSNIELTGSYEHTFEELEQGARMAWRHSNRCIGRLFWKSLQVFDARQVKSVQGIVDALFHHIEYASNGGQIRPTITVFHPSVRVWNHQLIRYAGYETADGIIGDPASLEFTKLCESLGWNGSHTRFDVLPLVVQVGSGEPQLYEIPPSLVLEVPINHPEFPGFRQLGLRWYGVPMISDMELEIGGIRYPAAPFNGWYMETEIGARDFADVARYNVLPQVASILELDTTSDTSLWKDKALVELNIAVLHSFKEQGVTIVDHHTAAKQFAHFERLESDAKRCVTGDWTWLIPPISPAATHIFHNQYDNAVVKPNYFHPSTDDNG